MTASGWRTGKIVLTSMLLGFIAFSARAQEQAIGYVKSIDGFVTVTHHDLTFAAGLGEPVHEGDTVRTYIGSAIGITFKDNTRIALGPSSRVTITRFVFAPAGERYGFGLRLIAGTIQYLSGLIAKLAPNSVKIETQTATIGVRGTRFLARTEP